jgi:hypothetical protein
VEAEIVRRAAARTGGEIRALRDEPTAYGVRTVGAITCADGWQAGAFLVALAAEEGRAPLARRLASELVPGATSPGALVRRVHAFVRRRIRFEREPGEIFTGLDYTLRTGVGDCDDHARAVYAILAAAGVPVRMAFLAKESDRGPRHVVVQAWDGRAWVWVETTIAAEVGEHPVAAGKRLGVLGSRADIAATEVRTMSESDLPPVPSTLARSSSRDELAADAEALGRLGYLEDTSPPANALETRFRRAVYAFQQASGLKPDGLIGPVTRGAIKQALPPSECGFTYLGSTGAPVRLTAHLSDAFFVGVKAMARRLAGLGASARAVDYLAVWLSESGLQPDAGVPGWPAVGLHQILRTQLRDVGWTGSGDDYKALSAEEQLPFIERWYVNRGPLLARVEDVASLYLCNFLPALLPGGAALDRVLLRQGGQGLGGNEGRFYRDNVGLDADRKGFITVGDLVASVERAQRGRAAYWAEIVARLGEAPDTEATLSVRGAGAVVVVLGTAAVLAHHVAGLT